MSYANNKGADQPAHLRSLTSAFVVRCLDSVISLVSVTKISSLMLASAAEQASLSLTWSETPEYTFSHDEAQYIWNSKQSSTAFDQGLHCLTLIRFRNVLCLTCPRVGIKVAILQLSLSTLVAVQTGHSFQRLSLNCSWETVVVSLEVTGGVRSACRVKSIYHSVWVFTL